MQPYGWKTGCGGSMYGCCGCDSPDQSRQAEHPPTRGMTQLQRPITSPYGRSEPRFLFRPGSAEPDLSRPEIDGVWLSELLA
jgi:hypothetical protein